MRECILPFKIVTYIFFVSHEGSWRRGSDLHDVGVRGSSIFKDVLLVYLSNRFANLFDLNMRGKEV